MGSRGLVVLMTPALALSFVFGAGCTNNGPPPAPPKHFAHKPEKKTALEVKAYDGVIHGKIVFDGDPPAMEFLSRINDHGDKLGCLKGGPAETHKQTWAVDPKTKAVANVVVWVDPPRGKFYTLREKDKDRAGELVVMDQPHCAFVPHVITLYPSYYDGERQVKTGQILQIRNSAPFAHTVQWNPHGANDAYAGQPMPPNGGKTNFVLNPEETCMVIGCGVHSWMRGILWIFDHPYHTVTKEDGTFRIENLPTGVELTFKAWHESNVNPFETRAITLTPGENPPIELSIKARADGPTKKKGR